MRRLESASARGQPLANRRHDERQSRFSLTTARQLITVRAVIKVFFFALSGLFAFDRLYAATNVWQPAPGHTQLPIWPGAKPDGSDAPPIRGPEHMSVSKNLVAGKPWVAVENVSQPTMTVYSPKETNIGLAVVVFPGGGYNLLAVDLEGTEICDWLNSRGITGVLLKYRAPTPKVGRYRESLQALQDAQRTLSLVRFHAHEWRIDPHKIGVIGFSAGGHLVAATSTHFRKRSYPPVDAADQVTSRPDFAIALYPGHLSPWYPDEPKSWANTKELGLNPNVVVTTNTPPTFLLQAQNDPVDDVRNSMAYSLALRNARVPVELHLYAEGGHGFGLRPTKSPITGWPHLVEEWLRTVGMIR
jgi:acetyl esterase/lipase